MTQSQIYFSFQKKKTKIAARQGDVVSDVAVPRSFVMHRGEIGKSILQLEVDLRRVMEPFTATNLKVRVSMSRKVLYKKTLLKVCSCDIPYCHIIAAFVKFLLFQLHKTKAADTITFVPLIENHKTLH